jgi:predicted Zn finger-like uncharacterized protein
LPEDGVIITCPDCETKYRYDERRFDGDAVKKVKCTSCGFTFEAKNPALQTATHPSAPAADSSSPGFRRKELTSEPPTPRPAAAEPEVVVDSPLPPLPSDPRYSLAVIAGGQAGSVFQLHKPRVLIGRGSAMDIQLRDSEVSRRHVAIEIRDLDVDLIDLEATNGTWFEGRRIDRVKLNHQDEFTLGSTTLMLIVTPVRGA